jgi:flagellar biogenesis protein FliO
MEVTALIGVFVVFGLLGLLLFALKRGGMVAFRGGILPRTSGQRELEIIERLALTQAHSLHMVRAGSRTLLIAVGPQSCQYIADVNANAKEGSRS